MRLKNIIVIVLAGVFLVCLGACSKSAKNPVATIEMESGEKIVIELTFDRAPETVRNFVYLANSGFYDGLTFHHIYPGFAILGGDPEGTGMGGPGYHIKGEFLENKFVQNDLNHSRGIVSMARGESYDSAGSQFFITVADASSVLNHLYAGFGIVKEGMDVVDRIASGASSEEQDGKAENPEVMKKVTVDTFGKDFGEPEKLT